MSELGICSIFEPRLKNELFLSAIITPFYKEKGERENLANWRPVTLLNTDYKLLALFIHITSAAQPRRSYFARTLERPLYMDTVRHRRESGIYKIRPYVLIILNKRRQEYYRASDPAQKS